MITKMNCNMFELNYYRRELIRKAEDHETLYVSAGDMYSWLQHHFDEHPVNFLGIEACKLSEDGRYKESNGKLKLSLDILMQTTTHLQILSDYRKNTFNNIGYNLIQMGDLDEAIEILEKAREIDPKTIFVNNNLGNAYELKGNLRIAKEFYQLELEHNPEHSTARESLKRVA